MTSNEIGQVSLDFLILACSFLAVLSLFVGVLNFVFAGASDGLELLDAARFCDEMTARSFELALWGEESRVLIAVSPKNTWLVSVEGSSLWVTVFLRDGSAKSFKRDLSLLGQTRFVMADPGVVVLERKNDSLVIQYQSQE